MCGLLQTYSSELDNAKRATLRDAADHDEFIKQQIQETRRYAVSKSGVCHVIPRDGHCGATAIRKSQELNGDVMLNTTAMREAIVAGFLRMPTEAQLIHVDALELPESTSRTSDYTELIKAGKLYWGQVEMELVATAFRQPITLHILSADRKHWGFMQLGPETLPTKETKKRVHVAFMETQGNNGHFECLHGGDFK
jgi:hypothetical protein